MAKLWEPADVRASFACDWRNGKGSFYPQDPPRHRTPYQRDRDRLIHSTGFRRLKHKTQVFVAPDGDHYRTRLTHSLEVAQIARAMASCLGVDVDLCEAIALAHDFGHAPFGHVGENALAHAMHDHGGFDHNVQTLRVVCLLEHSFAAWPGLNLSWECLEGLLKHNGPLTQLPAQLKTLGLPANMLDIPAHTQCSIEGQIAAIADDLAYNHHDLDDGLRAGLFTLDAVCDQVPHVEAMAQRCRVQNDFAGRDLPQKLQDEILSADIIRQLIGTMIDDVLQNAIRILNDDKIDTLDGVRNNARPIIVPSDAMESCLDDLRKFLFAHMLRAESVRRENEKAEVIVQDLFAAIKASAHELPALWRAKLQAAQGDEAMRVIADYVAGMTDSFAMSEHARLC